MDFIFRVLSAVLRRSLMIVNTFQARLRLGSSGRNIKIFFPNDFLYYGNVYVGNNVLIDKDSQFICTHAKIIIKDNTRIGKNSLLVAGNHNVVEIGRYMKGVDTKYPPNDKGIVINEDVFIIFNVTILDGVTIGRGAIVGTGAVVRKSVPPYSIVAGNPAKVIAFRFTPKQITEHELKLYKENERIPIDELESNYKLHFLNRLKEIVSFMNG